MNLVLSLIVILLLFTFFIKKLSDRIDKLEDSLLYVYKELSFITYSDKHIVAIKEEIKNVISHNN